MTGEKVDRCFTCQEPIKDIHYIACTILKNDGKEAIHTWCADLCQECSENLARRLKARW